MRIRTNARTARNHSRARYRPAVERLEKREVFATLTGVVFHDLNGDKVQDANELGLAGWRVFLETDRNNVFDPANDDSTLTDDNGGYSFEVSDQGPFLQFLGIFKPDSAAMEEWTPTTDAYGSVNYDPTRTPRTVLNFGVQLNSLGDLTRAGGEVLVNQNVEGVQGFSSLPLWGEGDIIDSDDAGNYVVGWSEVGSVPVGGIYTHRGFIRIYEAGGTPRTDAIELGTITSAEPINVSEPFVAISGDGTRIATSWEGVIRVYGDQGERIGAPVVANPTAKNEAYWVRAMDIDQNGDFVVVSTGYKRQGTSENSGITVFQRYSPNGVKVGNRIQVVDANLENGVQDVGMDAAGNFLITWTDSGLNGQRYSVSGAKLGSVIKFTPIHASNTAVSMLPNGKYALVWTQRETINGVLTSRVFARRYQPDGMPMGPAVFWNTDRTPSDIAFDADGTMRVTFASPGPTPGSTSWSPNGHNVFMRSISPSDILSDLIMVNSTWEGRQSNAQITNLKNGKWVVAWNGRGEGDSLGVFTQRFEIAPPVALSQASVQTSTASDPTSHPELATDQFYAQWDAELDETGRPKRNRTR